MLAFPEQFPRTLNLHQSIAKLAMAGEQAGFSVEQMIELLSAGLSVATLLDLIMWRLEIVGGEGLLRN